MRSQHDPRPTMFEGLEPRQLLSTYVVDHAGDESDDNFGAGNFSLREAIEQANANPGADEIIFDAGMDGETINLSRDLVWITDEVSVRGVDAENALISVTIHGDGFEVFHLDDGDDSGTIDTPVLLENLTINGGFSDAGGGIYSSEALTVLGCTIQFNSANRGGNIFQTGGSLTVLNSRITDGNATTGGGIAVDSADSFTLVSSYVTYNYAGSQAGIGVVGEPVQIVIEDSEIARNVAYTSNGAGIAIVGPHTLRLVASNVNRNDATSYNGGGLYLSGLTDALVLGSSFSHNLALDGAGLYIADAAGATKLHNSTVSENFATSDGGGVLFDSPGRHLRTRNNTIAYNEADTDGGGLYLRNGNAPLASNIIAHNQSSAGDSDIYEGSGHVIVEESSHNLIGSTTAGGLTDGTNGNMVNVDPKLGTIGRFAHLVEVYRLQADSPAIDAGLNPVNLATDGRSVDSFVRTFGEGTDIGAYELQTATFIVTTAEDELDAYGPGQTEVSLREAFGLANGNPGADTIEFAESVHGQTITLEYGSLVFTESLAVHGPGADLVTVDGNGGRVFEADNGASDYLDVTLRGLTLTGGYTGSNGGAVRFEYVYGVLDGMVFRGNVAFSGGGVYSNFGTLVVTNSTFAENTADFYGGGIRTSDSSVTVTGSTFSGNGATYGASAYLEGNDQTFSVSDSTFEGNAASYDGGGLYIDAGETTTLTVTGSTFTDNTARQGAGIHAYDASPIMMVDSIFTGNAVERTGGAIYSDAPLSIIGSTFRRNEAGTEDNGRGYGGAIYTSNYDITATVTDSLFEENVAHQEGGAIYRSGDGGLTITGTTISNNFGYNGGGGIRNYSGDLTVRNSTISGNTGGMGGGIMTDSNTTRLTIIDSAIDDNAATRSGGGIYTRPGPAIDIIGSSVSRNRADDDGGGIFLEEPASTTILNTTISSNSAQYYGGGLVVAMGNYLVSIANSTIADNHANVNGENDDARGGGILLFNETGPEYARIESTIVAGNLLGADSQPDEIYLEGTYGFDPDSGGFNLVQDASTAGGITHGERGNLVGVDAMLGELRDNGSGRMTHALPAGSPAIGTGSNPYGKDTDQRGAVFTRANGEPDIGAYERQTLTLTVTDASDEDDGDYSGGNLTLREAIGLSNGNPLDDSISFDSSLENATITLGGGELVISDDLILAGLGRHSLTIDAAGRSRIIRISDGTSNTTITVEISGLTLTGGSAANGGALRNDEDLTLRDARILGNNASGDGGGILNRGTLTLDDVGLLDNTAGDSGGAIDNDGEVSVTITNSVFSRNIAGGDAGAIDHDAGELSISRTTIGRNTSGGNGGGIANSGTLTLDQVEIFRNDAAGHGGGIYNAAGSSLDIDQSGISRNTAGGDGGGIYSAYDLRLINSTVSSNSANGSGGGIEASDARGGLYAVTLAENIADADANGSGSGGGVRIGKGNLIGQLEISYTIIANNTLGDATPSDIALWKGGSVQDSSAYNLIGNASGAGGLTDGLDGNIVGRDPRLGALGWYGGLTRTQPLLSGSPAIDAGATPQFLTTDQRGEDRGYGLESDIGAFEYQPTNYSLDVADGGTVAGAATGDNAHRFVIRNTEGDLVVFDNVSGQWAGYRLRELTGAPQATDEGILWTDPTDGLTYVAAPTAEGLILYTLDADGAWTYLNLTDELGVGGADVPARALTQLVTRGGDVIVAGLSSTGDLVAFKQTGERANGAPLWEFVDISADLAAQRMSTPDFTEMIGYVTAWNAWNFAGIDSNGDIQSVWVHPASFTRWRTDNLSDITGAPPLSGQLSVTLTSWSAINLGGVNAAGRLVVTWWVPNFKGKWVTSDLTNASGGETLQPGRVTGFVTPWGAINYAGLNGDGEVVAIWWTPTSGGWLNSPLTRNVDDSAPRPVGSLTSYVSEAGTMNILGASADDEAARLWWSPNSGGWQLDNLSDLAVRT